jgi:hypothetical protein
MGILEFRRKIDEYFDACAEDGIFPDEAGLLLLLNLGYDDLDRILYGGELRTRSARRALLDARLRRESLLTRELFATDKAATGKIFLARQVASGALSDKPRDTADAATIQVTLLGEELAFD